MMFPTSKNEQQARVMLRRIRQQRQRDAQQAVEAEFFQHSRVQHRRGRRRGGIAVRRPGVEREKRNQDAEPDQQRQVDGIARARD